MLVKTRTALPHRPLPFFVLKDNIYQTIYIEQNNINGDRNLVESVSTIIKVPFLFIITFKLRPLKHIKAHLQGKFMHMDHGHLDF